MQVCGARATVSGCSWVLARATDFPRQCQWQLDSVHFVSLLLAPTQSNFESDCLDAVQHAVSSAARHATGDICATASQLLQPTLSTDIWPAARLTSHATVARHHEQSQPTAAGQQQGSSQQAAWHRHGGGIARVRQFCQPLPPWRSPQVEVAQSFCLYKRQCTARTRPST